jgi:hypothetical protein
VGPRNDPAHLRTDSLFQHAIIQWAARKSSEDVLHVSGNSVLGITETPGHFLSQFSGFLNRVGATLGTVLAIEKKSRSNCRSSAQQHPLSVSAAFHLRPPGESSLTAFVMVSP